MESLYGGTARNKILTMPKFCLPLLIFLLSSWVVRGKLHGRKVRQELSVLGADEEQGGWQHPELLTTVLFWEKN